MTALFPDRIKRTASQSEKRTAIQTTVWLILGGLGLFIFIMFNLLKHDADPRIIAWSFLVIGIVATIGQPRYGLYIVLFFGLAGDPDIAAWYPFVKNFSSKESIFFLREAFIISPQELFMALTFGGWIVHGVLLRRLKLYWSPLLLPTALFIGFVTFGFFNGLRNGGNGNMALWQVRPIFYMPLMLLVTSNLLQKREHVNALIWVAMAAIIVKAIAGVSYFVIVLGASRVGIQSLTAHAASQQFNTVFVCIAAAWLLGGSWAKRLILPAFLPFVIIIYLVAQRRSAFLTLAIALFFVIMVLYKENRQLFWSIMIPSALIGVLYLGAFWNSGSSLGLPAQAIKSVIASDSANTEDQLSDIYRVVENINVGFTIRISPILGIGFGNPFAIIIPMPDISFTFDDWQFYPHNSVAWIWYNAGVGGFIGMLLLFGTSLSMAARSVIRVEDKDLKVAGVVAGTYLLMHFMFAYVDISWDVQSLLYVGAMMGLVGSLEHVASQPIAAKQKRWNWQEDPEPEVALLPFEREEVVYEQG